MKPNYFSLLIPNSDQHNNPQNRSQHKQRTQHRFFFCHLLIAGVLFFSPLSFADNLTDMQVTQWIKAWPTLQTWGDKHEKELKSHTGNVATNKPEDTIDNWFKNLAPQLKASGYYKEYSNLLKKHGFSSVEQWADISNRIFAATMSAQMEQQNPGIKAQMQASMEQLNAANLPPEQQKMMMQMMQQTQAAFRAMEKVPAADTAIITKHLPALRKILNIEE